MPITLPTRIPLLNPVVAGLLFALAAAPVHAATVSTSPSAPPIDGADIANFSLVTGADRVWTDEPAAGQSFTTGAKEVRLKAITWQTAAAATPAKTYLIRVGSVVAGTTFTEIHAETAAQQVAWNAGDYLTWTLDIPVTLAPGTTYGIDLAMLGSGTAPESGTPTLTRTADNRPGGTRYTSGSAGVGDASVNPEVGDRIFHLDLEEVIEPGAFLAPRIEFADGTVTISVNSTVAGRRYQLQESGTLAPGAWREVGAEWLGNGGPLAIPVPRIPGESRRFYRLALDPVPDGFSFIPAGAFEMGDSKEDSIVYGEVPVHSVRVSAFHMAKYEVTRDLWLAVRAWGVDHGYPDLPLLNEWFGSVPGNHPVHGISWFEMVQWCNARSEWDGLTPCYTVDGEIYKTGDRYDVACDWQANGYRLPTDAEWEKAARGGLNGMRFPWGDEISHDLANYFVWVRENENAYPYDKSVTAGRHPQVLAHIPYTTPVGSFPPNSYGLYDMTGNLQEWVWDWYDAYYFDTSPAADPRGPDEGDYKVGRGGHQGANAFFNRVSYRDDSLQPGGGNSTVGFRVARSVVLANGGGISP